MKVGIIGCGNMGKILIESLISIRAPEIGKIIVSDKNSKRIRDINQKYKIEITDNLKLVKLADVIIIAVKSQALTLLLRDISDSINSSSLVISIAAGIKISFMQRFFKTNVPIIRVMPNAACLVNEGISVLARGKFVSNEDVERTVKIFGQFGETVEINEKFMDVVTAISGSGPGYIAYIINSLIQESVSQGLSKRVATKLVIKTLIGTGRLLEKTGMEPAELIKKVASKGGTTEAALNVFRKKKLGKIVREAIKSATLRSKELLK